MIQDIKNTSPNDPARRLSKGAALFPLALVATAVAILAVGAGRTSEPPAKAQTRSAAAATADVASRQDIAQNNARAEEAAAAAMVALALARVAPTVDEARLAEAERAAPARAANAEPAAQDRKPVRQGAATNLTAPNPAANPATPANAAAKPVAPAPVAEPAPVFTAAPPRKVEEKPGVLRRVSEYIPSLPSPRRVVDAMGDGVSKLADLMPKF